MSPWVLILFFAAQSGSASFLAVEMTDRNSCEIARMSIEQKKYVLPQDEQDRGFPIGVCVER